MEAREAKKGRWVDPQPVPPWVYRITRRWVPASTGEVITMRDVFVSVVVGALFIGALVLIMFLG